MTETQLFGTLIGTLFGLLCAGGFLAYQHWRSQPAALPAKAKLTKARPAQKQPMDDSQYVSPLSN